MAPSVDTFSILKRAKRIAVVGASNKQTRASYFVMKYMTTKGYEIFPVNPHLAGTVILGRTVCSSLLEIPPETIDIVDIFRRPEEVPGIVDEAIEIGAGAIWMQLGIKNDAAALKAAAAGLDVVQDRCLKIEYGRYSGEMGWGGMNTGVISNRRTRKLDYGRK